MNKEDIYEGMRVFVVNTKPSKDIAGTVIDISCKQANYDCLVEFDEDVGGHDGLGWGSCAGKDGHCVWYDAKDLEEIQEDAPDPENYDIGYDDLF